MNNPNFDVSLLILVAGQIIGLCLFVWRVAIQYGALKSQIDQNRRDLNNVNAIIRDDIRNIYQMSRMEIGHIQEHLTSRDGYHPPSLKIWDKNFYS